jgi:hypothetical protein
MWSLSLLPAASELPDTYTEFRERYILNSLIAKALLLPVGAIRSEPFKLGVNYAWLNYGGDFGHNPAWGTYGISSPFCRQLVEDDFSRMATVGVRTVRWFLFCDGRTGIRFDNGIPVGLDPFVFKDLEAALEIAEWNNIQIAFVFFDFTWMFQEVEANGAKLYGHSGVLLSDAGQDALLDNVVSLVVARYRSHRSIYAWELMNEPEWIIQEIAPAWEMGLDRSISLESFKQFGRKAAALVHSSGNKMTLGSAKFEWLHHWADIGLDYKQFHFYPKTEGGQTGNGVEQLAQWLSLASFDRPLWLGEFPANDPSIQQYSMQRILDLCRQNDLAGASIWRWRKSETHSEERYGTPDVAVLSAWSKARKLQDDKDGSSSI